MTRRSELTGELFDTRLAAYALIEHEGKVLLTLWDMRHRDPRFIPRWSLPGGGVELGEQIQDGVRREVCEETGYEVDSLKLLDVSTGVIPAAKRYSGDGHPMQTVAVTYRARLAGGALRAEENGSTSQAAWFTREEVKQLNRIERVDAMLRLADEE
ncbi:NUDIX domain-containing protein [Glutamicibacter sp.]|uniref:NUDIX hydrolase n=1 Tax=Glutamicibacter sp. TaxID=1931995 RepID=UPI0028BF016A|nr:NUDIX domain-containing protein [Glutamicibacter sp.]